MSSRGLALLATSLGFGVVQLDVSVVNVAIKPIGADLGGSVSGLQWVVNAYTVALAAFILSAGATGDRLGSKRVFVSGFSLFTLASAACALAPRLGVLIATRAVQGVGAAILVPCSLSVLSHAYEEPRDRARAVGLWAAGASVALSAGPLVGGVLSSSLGWRSIFLINVPLGLLGILLTLRYAEETTRSSDRGIDVPGQVLAVLGLVLLAAATVEGGRDGFTSALVLAGYALAAVALVAFVVVESRSARPMLPLGLFRSRTFFSASAIGLVINTAFYGLIFVLSLWFQDVRHLSALQTGFAFAPTTVAVGLGNVLAGRLTDRWSKRAVLGASALLIAVSLLSLLVIGDDTPFGAIVVQLVALGAGLGVLVPVMTAALLSSVETSRSGVASGTLNTARQTGSVLGVALMGSLLSLGLVTGVRVSIAVALGLALVTALLSAGVREDV
jgi:MFS transporter, DHA2 family, methylenomycin A resistance protein